MNLPRPIRGIIPPVLKSLVDRDTLDAGSFERLIVHPIEGGLPREVIDRACAAVGKRVPLPVGITDTAFVESTKVEALSGADVTVPTYAGWSSRPWGNRPVLSE